MSSKLRSIFAKNALAAAELRSEAVKNAKARSETLRKRLARIGQETGPSTTIETIEWFADLVGVEPWELFVPAFAPGRRPRLLAGDDEITGLDNDELRLVRLLRERGAGKAAALLTGLEVGNGDRREPDLGGSGGFHGQDRRASSG